MEDTRSGSETDAEKKGTMAMDEVKDQITHHLRVRERDIPSSLQFNRSRRRLQCPVMQSRG